MQVLLPDGTTFYGDQVGSYFGHSIATGDFNGDETDDIVIGAPTFSKPNHYSCGRITITYQIKVSMGQ